jgi:hypothetical protein
VGTTLHIVDPKNPGAVDTIVHLGDFWDGECYYVDEGALDVVGLNAMAKSIIKEAPEAMLTTKFNGGLNCFKPEIASQIIYHRNHYQNNDNTGNSSAII